MDIRNVFLDTHGHLRSGLRFIIFFAVFLCLVIVFSLPYPFVSGYLSTNVSRLAGASVNLVTALLAGWLCGRFLEGLPFKALGLSFTKGWLTHLLIGLLVGAATLAFAVLIAMAFGGLRFAMNHADPAILAVSLGSSFVLLLVGAASEEALFRGYPFQTFTRAGLAWLAIVLTSIFFGAVHLRNENSGLISTLNTILAGLWFGIAYLKTRDLWLAIGIHLMWNWTQGALFGIEVSGFTDLATAPLLKEIDSGPQWLTGTTYGVEGGIVSTIALLVSTAVIYLLPMGEKLRHGDSETL
jgi:uncharacterized protein